MTERGPWRPVHADDVPILATIRGTDGIRSVVGTVVDVIRQHGMTAFIVRDTDGHHYVVPTTAEFEIHDETE